MKTASAESRKKMAASSSRRPVRGSERLGRQDLGGGRTRVYIEEVAWRPSGDGRFGWFGPQNHQAGRFTGLGLKTGGASGAAGWAVWRTRGVIAKLASRRSKVVKAACPSDAPGKSWTKTPLRGQLSRTSLEGQFGHSATCLYKEGG